MADVFDPNEFATFKSQRGSAPPSSASFDASEFDAFKAGRPDARVGTMIEEIPDTALRIKVGGPPPRPAMGTGEAALRGIEAGATMNFGDEMRGVMSASTFDETAPSWLKDSWLRYSPLVAVARGLEGGQNLIRGDQAAQARYDAAVAENRALQDQAAAEHPVANLAGQVGGGLATGIVTPMLTPFRAAQGAGIVARGAAATGNLAATGAAYGGVAGAGGAEGSIAERLPGAAIGAGVGAVATPIIGGAIRGAQAGARFVADNANAVRDPAALADRVISRAVQRDGTNLAQAADDIERAGAQGQSLTLADVAGENTRGLAGNIARMPGEGRTPAREFLEGRQLGNETTPSQAERISDRVSALLGDRGAIETADEIIARRAAQARPAYDRAHQVKLDFGKPEGQNLLALLDRIPNEARNEANRILRISDREGSQLIWQPDANGGFSLSTAPNSRAFDYITRGINTMIDRNTNPTTGELNTLGGALVGLKKDILSSLDKLNPAYAAARKQFAGETELVDALRLGQTVMQPKATPEAVRKMMAGLSPGEADMFRLGAANAIRDRLANAGDGADKVRLAWGTPAVREKITALAPDKAAREAFNGFMRNETAMFRTKAESLGGSPTQPRLADQTDLDQGIAGGLAGAAFMGFQGRPAAAMRHVVDTIRQINPAMRGKVLDAARKVLLDPSPDAGLEFVKRIEGANMKAAQRERIIKAVISGVPRAALAPITAD